MEEVAHCKPHCERPAEYVRLASKNLHLCGVCRLEHAKETGHATENCKEVGLAIMNQHIQCAGGRLAKEKAKELAKGLIEVVKELEAGVLREVDRFQKSCAQNDEQCGKMQQLDRKGKYDELYLFAKSLPAGDATKELNKRLLEMIGAASAGLKKIRSEIAPATAQYKPVFAAYQKDEAFVLGESVRDREKVISALHSADMSTKIKAIRIHIGCTSGDSVASELASCLQQAHHTISALYLGGRDISDAGAQLLAQAAFQNKSLSAFCIASSSISDTGARAVAEAARGCHSLTMLYLHGWRISDSGALAVAEAVKDCPLSSFYLGGCRISDSAAISIADKVKDCPLSAFCFWSSEISDAGAIAVADKVKDCSLSAFYLGGRDISDSGATAVVETLSSDGCANTLSAFCLESRCLSDSGAKKVADVARCCPKLSSFCLDCKLISGETAAYILEGMAGASTIRSVSLRVGEVSEGKMNSCLDRLQQSGTAKRLKLRFRCDTEAAQSVCDEFAAEWDAKLAEFMIIPVIVSLFENEMILGSPI